MYGLPEAAKLFNDFVNEQMKSKGYSRSEIGPCLFFKFIGTEYVYVVAHVDDMAALTSSQHMLDEVFMKDMRHLFRIKDEGEIERFLEVDLKKDGDTPVISQERYIEQMIKRFNITKPKTYPVTEQQMDKSPKRQEKRGEMETVVMEMVGSLRYVADGSRWDIPIAAGRAASDITGGIATQTMQYLLVTKGEF